MGERQNQPFQFSFNAALKVDFQGSRVTSDGGLILVRESDEHLGFGALIKQHLADPRRKNTRLPFADLLRQSVYSRLAGYEDMNDAERLSQDPTFRLIGSEKIWERGAALTSRLQSFETELLTQDENLAGLAAINRDLIAETVDRMPTFRDAFRQSRCLVIADGFHEWQTTGWGKQPYRIVLSTDEPFAFAGIWRERQGEPAYVILTMEANTVMRPIGVVAEI